MTGPLHGCTVLVPESRDGELFAGMLKAEGAVTLRCPLVQICDLDDKRAARAWMARLIAGAFADVIWLTGEGLRRLLAIAEADGKRDDFVAALGRSRMITRGPKPARALRELALAPGIAATTPTSQGVLEVLAPENLAGRTIGVQLYPGDRAAPLLARLGERGAIVDPVTPYRYASQTETAQVIGAIERLVAGRIDVIAFTASSQVERLFAVAQQAGLGVALNSALQSIRVAAIGPVVEETLRRHGLATVIRPKTSFHLKPLVREIVAACGSP